MNPFEKINNRRDEIERMANDISKVYPGNRWKDKVNNMSASQIVAIYHNFKKKGYFDGRKPSTNKNKEERSVKKSKEIPGQINMFEYFKEEHT